MGSALFEHLFGVYLNYYVERGGILWELWIY